ncbi:MAG: hypothetical protein Q4P30_03000 [Eubacteriales bacterium]|nr:hypothetical protein [Eubacteriales bacterium]
MLADKGRKWLLDAIHNKKKLNDYEERVQKLEKEAESFRKRQTSFEAGIEHEINKKISESRRNIERMYGERFDEIQKEIKSEEGRRKKSKEKQVRKRIDETNESLIIANRGLDEQLNSLSEKHKVSVKSNSRLYFTLLTPKGAKECAIAGAIVFGLTALVLLLLRFLIPDNVQWIFFILFSAVYALIYIIKSNYVTTNMRYLEESRQIYDKMQNNERIMAANAEKVRNDPREGIYDLKSFDERLAELRKLLENQLLEKDAKLHEFEAKTAKEMEANIREHYAEEVRNGIKQVEEKAKELDETRKNRNRLRDFVRQNYDDQLPEDLRSIECLTDLAEKIEHGDAGNVEEARVQYYAGE